MLKELEICPHLPKLLSNIKWLTFLEHGVFLQTLTIWFLGLRSQPWFYPALHNRGGCKQEPGGITHGYTRDLLTSFTTKLNAAVYI